MKNKILLSLCLLLTITLASFGQNLYKVTADKLNVRESNNSGSKIIGFVPQNQNVEVLDSSDAKFYKIKVTNGEGWASKEFLTRVSPLPIKKVEPAPIAPKVEKAEKSNSNVFLIAVLAIVLLSTLFLIVKFLKRNILLMVISSVVVIAIGYLSFTTLFSTRKIEGKFTSDSDTQYLSFEFKPNNTVLIEDTIADTVFTASYRIEGDIITAKQQENTILLLIRDEKTLIGEGFTKGVFNKN